MAPQHSRYEALAPAVSTPTLVVTHRREQRRLPLCTVVSEEEVKFRSIMLDYLIVFTVGLAGFAGEGWWFILLGAVALCIGSWTATLKMLKDHPSVPFDATIASFFTSTFGTALIACAGSYIMGIVGRAITLLL